MDIIWYIKLIDLLVNQSSPFVCTEGVIQDIVVGGGLYNIIIRNYPTHIRSINHVNTFNRAEQVF